MRSGQECLTTPLLTASRPAHLGRLDDQTVARFTNVSQSDVRPRHQAIRRRPSALSLTSEAIRRQSRSTAGSNLRRSDHIRADARPQRPGKRERNRAARRSGFKFSHIQNSQWWSAAVWLIRPYGFSPRRPAITCAIALDCNVARASSLSHAECGVRMTFG